MEIKRVHMGPAQCALDITDGSERAEYVPQDYILWKLGRPHRAVNIMYTYYPKDKEWPARISEACKDMNVTFQWDYPYDDYFPYGVGGEPFESMKDIRRHGQDVMLTLTIDCSLEDSYLRDIAKQLRPFGRMRLRINHECCGDWFTHNKRFTFAQIAEFFARFNSILKEEAPNVRTIFCAGLIEDGEENADGKVVCEDDFACAYEAADIWSADKYIALHFGWPYDIAEVGGGQYCWQVVDEEFECFKRSYARLKERFGDKPMIMGELNTDGDVTGALNQADSVVRFYNMVRDDATGFLKGIAMYQFRDRGRLGLEIEDPNNKHVGIEQPLLKEYKKIMNEPYFMPSMEESGDDLGSLPITLRWGGSEDADGIGIDMHFDETPQFCEITAQKDLALMIEFMGKWFYKAAGVGTIDLMPAFYEKPLSGASDIRVNIFATPADGINEESERKDWAENCYFTMNEAPSFRIRYEVPGVVR